MNKILLVIWLVFATSNLAFAQTTSNSDWKTYTLVNKEFSLEMPIGKTMRGFGEKGVRHAVVTDDAYFFVFSDLPKTTPQTKLVREIIKAHKAVGSSSAVGNAVGEKFVFTDADDFYQTILIVQTKAGSYVFYTLSETEYNPSVERFFASIQFNFDEMPGDESASPDNPDENISAPNSPESNPKEYFANGVSKENGARQGNVNGVESGGLKKAIPPAATNQNTDLKILSKSGARYTDLARSYGISGTTQLRITFLASGEIGAIETLKKLPFGLTASAVNAARQIQFEPAMKDGKPYTVAKIIHYSFSLF
jgi:hypothetical protein